MTGFTEHALLLTAHTSRDDTEAATTTSAESLFNAIMEGTDDDVEDDEDA